MKSEHGMEDQNEIAPIKSKVDQLQRATRMVIIMLAVILLLNGVIVYFQISRVGDIHNSVDQQTTRIDDLLINLGNLADNSIGTTTEIGGIKQDVSTVVNMLRDIKIAASLPASSSTELKSPLHVQFTCLDESSSQPVEPCSINVKILEINPVDEFVMDTSQTLEVVPVRIRLSISVNVSGYAAYSNIFEYTENGQTYPVEIRLKK